MWERRDVEDTENNPGDRHHFRSQVSRHSGTKRQRSKGKIAKPTALE